MPRLQPDYTWLDDICREAEHVHDLRRDHDYDGGQILADMIMGGSHQAYSNNKDTGIHVEVTRYQINGLPKDHIDASVWNLTVEYRGRGQWAVMHLGYAYAHDGSGRTYEPSPSNRDDDFLANYRWDSAEEAIEFAKRELPKLVVNGLRVENGELIRVR